MNRNLYFRTAPCYHSMQLNKFLFVSVLNNGQNINFGHVYGWSIGGANLSYLKNEFRPKECRPKTS